jgi:hypothetical protein
MSAPSQPWQRSPDPEEPRRRRGLCCGSLEMTPPGGCARDRCCKWVSYIDVPGACVLVVCWLIPTSHPTHTPFPPQPKTVWLVVWTATSVGFLVGMTNASSMVFLPGFLEQ